MTKKQLFHEHSHLVDGIARSHDGHGLPMPIMAKEGRLGLMKAARRFVPNNGHSFPTYAKWWIERFIRKALVANLKATRRN